MATHTEQTAHQDRTLVYHQCSRLDGFFTRDELHKLGHVPQHDTNVLHYSEAWFEGNATENTPELVVFPTLHANAERAVQSAQFLLMTRPPARSIYNWVIEHHHEAYEQMLAAQARDKSRPYTLQPLKPWAEEDIVFRDFTPEFIERKVLQTVAANFKEGLITNNPGDRWYVRPIAYRDMPWRDGHPVPHMGVASLDCDVVFEISVRNVQDYTSGTPSFVLFRLPPSLTPEEARRYLRMMNGDTSLYELCEGHDNLNGSHKVNANYTLLGRMKNMAKLNGFEDGLYVDPSPDQNLCEGGGMNVALLSKEGDELVLRTPSTELQHILPGTKRALALEQARSLGFRVIDNENVPSRDIRRALSVITFGSWARENPAGYLVDFPTGEYSRLDGFVSEEALFLARQNRALIQLGEVDPRIKHLQQEPHLTVVSLDELVKMAT